MFQFQGPVTLAEVSATLKGLIEELVPGGNAIYVAVEPAEGAPPNECFPLVEGHAKKFGGRALVGWTLWELPSLFVEAEFHSVWEKPNGGLVDITPKQRETQQVFFLNDPYLKYEGRQLDNVRKPIKKAPLLFEYLKTFEAEFELMNRGGESQSAWRDYTGRERSSGF
jgi:hypothetical protein